jgi:hypothetical protein
MPTVKRIEELEEVVSSWKRWHRDLSDALGCKYVERAVTLAAVKRLQQALKFYEDEQNYLEGRGAGVQRESPIKIDMGRIARYALEGKDV